MYRSILVSFVVVASACEGGANSASAASSNSAALASVPGQSAATSDTSGSATGPISTTENGASGSAASTAASSPAGATTTRFASSPAADSPAPVSAQGAGKPNRVPNEMGRIMVLEYHLITDHNGDYARERGQFRKDLELLYNRGYRPVNMSDVLDKKLDLPRGLSPVVFVFDDASPEQFSYIENNGKLTIDPNSGMGIWLDFKKTHPDWANKAV
jgi:hypothetical protein